MNANWVLDDVVQSNLTPYPPTSNPRWGNAYYVRYIRDVGQQLALYYGVF